METKPSSSKKDIDVNGTGRADFTGMLPTELSQQVFSQIDAETLDSCLLVSQRWKYYSSRARAARGKRHVKLLFETIGAGNDVEKSATYWLWSKDHITIIHQILADISAKYFLTELSSFEWSFDNSFEADIAKLLQAESASVMTIQLRVSGYLDELTHPDNQLKILYSPNHEIDRPMTYGVLTRKSTTLLV